MTHKLDLTDLQDQAELTQGQMKQLWALFSQIQHNLNQDKVHPSTRYLSEIGNFLTDMWNFEHGELYEQISTQLGNRPDE